MITKEFTEISPLLEVIISHIDDGVIIFGKNQKIFYTNPSVLKLLNLPPSSKVQHFSDISTLHLEDFAEDLLNAEPKLTIEGKNTPLSTSEIRLIQDDKTYRDLKIQCCFSCNIQQEDQLYLLILTDITQQKKFDSYLKDAAEDLITNDPKMLHLLHKIKIIASSTANILLQGESGTGKTHIAKFIHKLSNRADQPLITLNCAAIPDQLLESELFGHVKNDLEPNSLQRQGRFKYADQGTLLLDEIGEIPFHLQAKLLRAIQDQEFEPVGSDKTTKVDVRIIASSNQNLLEMVNKGTFRADLYYRLAVIPLYIPALKDRPGDIPLLITHFCHKLMSRGYQQKALECGADTMRIMMNYTWPGNVRELENAVEHAIICSQGDSVEPESLPLEITARTQKLQDDSQQMFQKGHEDILRNEIIIALENTGGNKTKAARELGVDRSTLWRRMRKLHIQE